MFNKCFNQYTYGSCFKHCPPPCPHPAPKPQIFQSSYVEAVASTQTVPNGANFVFDTAPEAIDIGGNDIEISDDGSGFLIKKPGLYFVEWSVNLNSAINPVVVCLMENNNPTSALSNNMQSGNFASGAVINIKETDIPFTLSLHNFGGQLLISDHVGFINTAASIRIIRFADKTSL